MRNWEESRTMMELVMVMFISNVLVGFQISIPSPLNYFFLFKGASSTA
jgi:hypothetical protein